MLQRGVGEGAVGSSLSLVSPMEDKSHSKIVEALQVAFSKFLLDGRLMSSAQARTNLASKIVVASELEQKAKSRKNWFLENAKEAEMEIDTDLLGHSYYGDCLPLLQDVDKLMVGNVPPAQRGLNANVVLDGRYWTFR